MPLGRRPLWSAPNAADFDFIMQPSEPFTYGLQMEFVIYLSSFSSENGSKRGENMQNIIH